MTKSGFIFMVQIFFYICILNNLNIMDKVLQHKLEKLSKLKDLECDGLTRAIDFILNKHNVKHKVCIGTLHGPKGSIVHYWIELSDGRYVDYRARMWQGDLSFIPDGIFDAKDYDAVRYEVEQKVDLHTRDSVYNLLVGYNKEYVDLVV